MLACVIWRLLSGRLWQYLNHCRQPARCKPCIHILGGEIVAYDLPVLPDNKVMFYKKKLVREVSNLFKWEGLPDEIPYDYLEKTLISQGMAMFFYDENAYGYMALRCGKRGHNLYDQPTTAFAVAPNDQLLKTNYTRTIVHRYDEDIGKDKACVLINNMYMGEGLNEIIDHYAYRLALVQQAFDTNAIWQNVPVIMTVDNANMKLSVDKLFADIFKGKPWVLVDNQLLGKENGTQADPITVPFLLDKLYDAKNEIYNEFKATIGIDHVAVDKKERLIVGEVESNEQSTETCLEIMLSQRRIACEEINKVFGLNISVKVNGDYDLGGEDSGTGDNGVEELVGDEEL